MSESIEQLLAAAESTLTRLQTATERALAMALSFGDYIGDIGRELTQHPDLVDKVQAFVERTAPAVRMDPGIWRWIHRVYEAADSRSSETEDYKRALEMRSQLEFFRDLYRDSEAHDYVAGIETEPTDDNLKEWSSQMHLDVIPPGFPTSHSWWYQSRHSSR